MDKILRIGPPQAFGVSDGLYSFVVRLNEADKMSRRGDSDDVYLEGEASRGGCGPPQPIRTRGCCLGHHDR